MQPCTPSNPSSVALTKVKDKFDIPTTCHICDSTVILATNDIIYNGKQYGDWPYLYYCTGCHASVGLHPLTNLPLGTLADGALRKKRMKVKELFNPLWQQGGMTRSGAYLWLAKQLNISESKCHFGLFDQAHCDTATKVIGNYQSPVQPDWKTKLKSIKT